MKKLIQLSLVAVLLLSVAFGLFQATRYTTAPAITSSCSSQGLLHSDGNCMKPDVGWNKGLTWAGPLPVVQPMVGWNA